MDNYDRMKRRENPRGKIEGLRGAIRGLTPYGRSEGRIGRVFTKPEQRKVLENNAPRRRAIYKVYKKQGLSGPAARLMALLHTHPENEVSVKEASEYVGMKDRRKMKRVIGELERRGIAMKSTLPTTKEEIIGLTVYRERSGPPDAATREQNQRVIMDRIVKR